ncbi:unnamed protein product [Acanthoscelides obtectus]|uniref:Reverse transcriptase domain-containing protein n=1 Tax=Acanthoscelides obtectus TaxID=200917 RepID=A0A9P0JRY1_ACAOB|nr:unnamed protein product [Acanthoscelides obtectus]CAK1668086.1 hypothetical protein AOBTE_LOCUS26215 [Acanthoscelides obtectus]
MEETSVCSSITEIIHVGMEEYISHTVKVPRPGSNGWFNKSCGAARQQKIKAHRTFLQNPTHDIKVRHRVMSQRNGSRSFWTLAKQIVKNFSHSSLPPLTCQDGTIVFNSKANAEVLAKIFAANSIMDVTFRHKTVRRVLLSLDINKASGPDLIPAIVLKRCAPELAPVPSRLFQISYESGTFPENCKFAHGSKTDPYNYRPIALLSVLSKVMESDRQYGFRHQRSTGDLLAYAHVVALDIMKAISVSCTINLIHSFADDSTLHARIQIGKRRLAMTSSLTRDLHSFRLVGHEHISSIAAYFSPHDLLILYKAQIRPSLKYCSHIWGAAAPTTLSMLDAVQRRAVRLINDSSLTDSLGTLSHRRAVGELALFYQLCSMMPPRDVPARQTRLTLASHPNRVELRTSRTGRYDRSFVPRVSRLWNNLQEEAFPSSINLRHLKNRINKISLGSS